MRKLTLLLFLFVSLSLLAGCQKSVTDPAIVVSQVQSIDVFTGSVPAAAVKKTVTSGDDIERLVHVINGLTIIGRASVNDQVSGGIGIYFQVHRLDGEDIVVYVSGNGDLVQQDGTMHKINRIDINGLWDSLDYREIYVGEEGLPAE